MKPNTMWVYNTEGPRILKHHLQHLCQLSTWKEFCPFFIVCYTITATIIAMTLSPVAHQPPKELDLEGILRQGTLCSIYLDWDWEHLGFSADVTLHKYTSGSDCVNTSGLFWPQVTRGQHPSLPLSLFLSLSLTGTHLKVLIELQLTSSLQNSKVTCLKKTKKNSGAIGSVTIFF